MADEYDDNFKSSKEKDLTPLNIKKNQNPSVAVAIKDSKTENDAPTISAAGRGKIAEQILQLAFESDIKVREDAALAEMLTSIELDSPIPSEAFMAVAEILSYVYRANGQKHPYDAILSPLPPEGTQTKKQSNAPSLDQAPLNKDDM